MSGGGKFVATGGETRSKKVVVKEKGRKLHTKRERAMDFDAKPRVLRGHKDVDEYLASYDVHLPSKIEVEWCSLETNVTVSPLTGTV